MSTDDTVARLDYVDFELIVGPGEARTYPVSVRSTAGEATVTLAFPFDEATLENRLLSLENAMLRSSGTRRLAPSAKERTVQEFGQELFDALLVDDARRLYYESQGDVSQRGQRLRIKLRFDSPELAALPWEFLFDPRVGDFVSLSVNTPIVRYIGMPQPVTPLRITLPLRVLGMVAAPQGLVPLDVAKEQQQIDRALQDLCDAGHMTMKWLAGQTWNDLQREIRQHEFNVFHFIGHGTFDPDSDEGLIVLADETGNAYRLPATELAMLLADEPKLRLVVLNSCEGAQGGSRDIFASTASILVRRGVPAVLAMQYEITDQAAIAFSRAFYEAVADGEPMEAAVAEGRKAVRLAIPGSLEWATPVLYLRSDDGILFDPGTIVHKVTNGRAVAAAQGADQSAPSATTAGLVAPGASATSAGAGIPHVERPVSEGPGTGRIPPRTIAMALVGLIAVVALLFVGLRYLNPEPLPQPTALSGLFEDGSVRIDRLITLGHFCDGIENPACDRYDSQQRGWPGYAVRFTILTRGYVGEPLSLEWSLRDAASRAPLPEPNVIDQPGWPIKSYTPAADSDRNAEEIWVPGPVTSTPFFVELTLSAPDGTLLDTAETDPIDAT